MAFSPHTAAIQGDRDTIRARCIDPIVILRLLRTDMTVNGTFRSNLRDATRRAGGFASFAYYYGYISARAETV